MNDDTGPETPDDYLRREQRVDALTNSVLEALSREPNVWEYCRLKHAIRTQLAEWDSEAGGRSINSDPVGGELSDLVRALREGCRSGGVLSTKGDAERIRSMGFNAIELPRFSDVVGPGSLTSNREGDAARRSGRLSEWMDREIDRLEEQAQQVQRRQSVFGSTGPYEPIEPLEIRPPGETGTDDGERVDPWDFFPYELDDEAIHHLSCPTPDLTDDPNPRSSALDRAERITEEIEAERKRLERMPTAELEQLRDEADEVYQEARYGDDPSPLETVRATKRLNTIEEVLVERREREREREQEDEDR